MVPSSTLGLHLQDKEFRLCLQYWLGLRMSEDGATCPVCQGAADAYGDHQVGCGGNGDKIHRHDSIRDAVYSAAQSAALAPRKEAPSVIPGSSSRPADVYLPNWKRGQPAALDSHVISTMQQQTLVGASTTPGHALGQRLGIPPPETTCHLFQRLSISLRRGNASLWVRRQPALSATVDGIV